LVGPSLILTSRDRKSSHELLFEVETAKKALGLARTERLFLVAMFNVHLSNRHDINFRKSFGNF
jgi:hypothetical protein